MSRSVPLYLVALLVAGLSLPALGQGSQVFRAEMSGTEEVPPNASAATGRVKLRVNPELTEIDFELEIRDATNILSAAGAHLHCGERGTNGPVVVFLAGVVPGMTGGAPGGFDGRVEVKAVLTADNITNTACGATIADLVQSMRDGRVYANAHSVAFPGGEIRGQVESE